MEMSFRHILDVCVREYDLMEKLRESIEEFMMKTSVEHKSHRRKQRRLGLEVDMKDLVIYDFPVGSKVRIKQGVPKGYRDYGVNMVLPEGVILEVTDPTLPSGGRFLWKDHIPVINPYYPALGSPILQIRQDHIELVTEDAPSAESIVKSCSCTLVTLMNTGCICGGV